MVSIFQPPLPAPTLTNFSIAPTKSGINIHAILNDVSGEVHCGIFTPGTNLTSLSVIAVQNFATTVASNSTSSSTTSAVIVNITGLYPSSDYELNCYTVSSRSMSTVLALVNSDFKTLYCRPIIVTTLNPMALSLTVNTEFPPASAITVTVSSLFWNHQCRYFWISSSNSGVQSNNCFCGYSEYWVCCSSSRITN